MKITIYEEFPTDENLAKIKLMKFPAKLIVAAKSLKKFYSICKKIKE